MKDLYKARIANPRQRALFAQGREPALLLGRGFTGHEHLPWFGLINCNARLYDPVVGRFLSPDPFIQNPLLSQNFNRYTYALNNPLRFIDPTGYVWIRIAEYVWETNDSDFIYRFLQWLNEAQEADDCFDGLSWNSMDDFVRRQNEAAGFGFFNDDVTWHFYLPTVVITGSRDNWTPIRSPGNWPTMGQSNWGNSQGQTTSGEPFRIARGIYARRFESTHVFSVDRRWMSGGIALPGIGIVVCPRGFNDMHLLRHEYGHLLQRRQLGMFAFGLIGILSLGSAAFDPANHRYRWFEIDANRRAYRHFGNDDWPDDCFPRRRPR